MSRRNKKKKEEICEDYCFSCKDGGHLRICDYKDCLKTYHPDCVDKDETFLESEERWSCKWHSCFICNHRLSKFRCLCCPRAVCGRCLHDAELAIIKADKGICQVCLNLAILCEIGSPDDSEEVVDFKDENSYEFFFIGYWEYIKEKEGLTRESLNRAKELLKKNKNYRNDLLFHQTGKIGENIGESEEESDCIISDYDDLEEQWKKRRKSTKKSGGARKKEKPKKKEFNGWGSQSLLEFLHCVDRDTNKPMSENEVVSVVMKYCIENKLFDPQKRKRIICDETLQSLFGKKFILKNSLSKLLGAHFASNVDESSGNDIVSGSDDEDNVVFKRRKTSSSPQKTQKEEEKEKVKPEVPKSCYALVATENIKLVYLKRSLVDELSKQEEEFEKKVVGSFVRVKCNPNDYLQRNSHQLLQVKGVTKSSNGNILLQLFDRPEDFPFDELSDDSFTEEECEDLCRKVKDGLLKKLTIVELEQKARSLHKDMINHWITKELAFLKRRIDQANEKGWRRELNDYLERIQLLNDTSERERLLNEYPDIIAEAIVQEPERDDKDERSSSFDWSDLGSENFSYQNENEDQRNQGVTSTCEKPSQESQVLSQQVRDNNVLEMNHHQPILEINGSCCKKLFPEELRQKRQASIFEGATDTNIQTQLESSSSSALGLSNANKPLRDRQAMAENQSTFKVEVIELSDDELEENRDETKSKPTEDQSFKERQRTSSVEIVDLTDIKKYNKPEDSNSTLWYCRSGLGYKAGPFKMSSIKSCFDTRDHKLEIKVWKSGEREEDALSLEDVIHKLFP